MEAGEEEGHLWGSVQPKARLWLWASLVFEGSFPLRTPGEESSLLVDLLAGLSPCCWGWTAILGTCSVCPPSIGGL
jgi:hypothetical protein